jgi:hypothetical protein
MVRVETEELRDAERIFIAKSLRLALQVEEHLTAAGVDYAVEVESIGRSLLFRTERMGAAFYVNSGQAAYCREQLSTRGWGSGVVESDANPSG